MTRSLQNKKRETGAVAMAPVTDILGRVVDELRQAAVLVDQMPISVERLMQGIDSGDKRFVRAMQSLDYTAQKLSGLADFLSALALRAPSHWLLDPNPASQVVTLAELASRLRFPLDGGAGGNTADSDGECEFF